jgi:hypothetical protein
MGGNSGGHPGRQRSAGSFAAVRRATGPNNQKAADATTRRRTLSRPCWRAFAHLAFVASCLSPPPCFCTSICAQMWLRLYRFTPGERRARAHRRTAAHDRELGRKVGTMCRRTGRESKRAAEERRGRWKSRPAGERCGDASERRCGSAAARQRGSAAALPSAPARVLLQTAPVQRAPGGRAAEVKPSTRDRGQHIRRGRSPRTRLDVGSREAERRRLQRPRYGDRRVIRAAYVRSNAITSTSVSKPPS